MEMLPHIYVDRFFLFFSRVKSLPRTLERTWFALLPTPELPNLASSIKETEVSEEGDQPQLQAYSYYPEVNRAQF